jgi:hypothetical protein
MGDEQIKLLSKQDNLDKYLSLFRQMTLSDVKEVTDRLEKKQYRIDNRKYYIS